MNGNNTLNEEEIAALDTNSTKNRQEIKNIVYIFATNTPNPNKRTEGHLTYLHAITIFCLQNSVTYYITITDTSPIYFYILFSEISYLPRKDNGYLSYLHHIYICYLRKEIR